MYRKYVVMHILPQLINLAVCHLRGNHTVTLYEMHRKIRYHSASGL